MFIWDNLFSSGFVEMDKIIIICTYIENYCLKCLEAKEQYYIRFSVYFDIFFSFLVTNGEYENMT